MSSKRIRSIQKDINNKLKERDRTLIQIGEIIRDMNNTNTDGTVNDKIEKKVFSCYDKNNNLPVILVKFHDVITPALIDTGANVSLANPNLINKIKENTKIEYISRNVRIQTLNNNSIPFSSAALISFRIENQFFKNTFFITKHDWNCKYQIILGYDFLKKHKAVINADENSLQIGRNKLKLIEDPQQPMLHSITSKQFQHFAKITHKIKLNPNSTKLVKIKIPRNTNDNFLVYNNNIKGINIEDSLNVADNENCTFIFIQNTSNQSILIRKGTKIAKLDFQEWQQEEPEINVVHNIKEEILNLRKQEISKEDFNLNHLDEKTKSVALKFLLDNYACFSKSYKTLGETDAVKPQFKLLHDHPIQSRSFPIPNIAREFAKNEIKSLLDAGIIEPSNSSYAFPVIFVKKKMNPEDPNSQLKFRMVIDYRLLNDITESFKIHLPQITEILHQIAGKKYYCVLDLKSAFFQIKLDPEQRHKLSFVTPEGNFRPCRLPFGSKNSSSFFSALILQCLGDLRGPNVQFYLDDIIVGQDNVPELLNTLQKVFDKLKEFNLTLDPSKLQMIKTQIEFLGYSVSENGFSPSQVNINKVTSFPVPKNIKNVKSYLGLAGFYRHLIPNYAEIVEPLVNLTRKGVKFSWTSECQKAFDIIQKELLKKPSLSHVDINRDFYLVTDASKIAISAILMQKNDVNQFVPISFFSRQLSPTEMRYPAIKQELFAIYSAVKHFKDFLYARPFYIFTDNKALTYHLSLNKQPDIITRWLMFLQDFQYQINHIEGVKNPADFLSRVTHQSPSHPLIINNIFAFNADLSSDNILKEQVKDSELRKIRERIEKNDLKAKRRYFIQKNTQLLCRKSKMNKHKSYKIYIPKSLIKSCLNLAHKSHFGSTKTYNFFKDIYFWPGSLSDTKNFCATCESCIKNKPKRLDTSTHFIPKAHLISGNQISIDIVGILPRSANNHNYILTIIDNYSRFLEAVPLTSITSNAIIKALNNYFSLFGVPKVIISDNGSYFTSKEFQSFINGLNIQHNKSSIFYPKSNGLLERSHSILKQSIAAISQETFNWDKNLLLFKLYYNNSLHKGTGFSPAQLFFGRDLNTPISLNIPAKEAKNYEEQFKEIQEMQSRARKKIQELETKMSEELNNTNTTVPKLFQVEDTVFLKSLITPSALQPKFNGPYKILKQLRNDNFIIQDSQDPSAKTIKIHKSKLYRVPLKRTNLQ